MRPRCPAPTLPPRDQRPVPWLGRCAGRKLLESVLENVVKSTGIARVYLHVWTSNAPALAFYERFGFHVSATIKDYYKRISPPDAFVLERAVEPTA